MIPVHTFKDKRVAVFGLGMSGISAAKALMAGGADVCCCDDRDDGKKAAVLNGLPYADLKTADWRSFSALVLAPGVPLTHPKPHWTVELARAAGVEIIGDTELFFRAHQDAGSKAKIVAITGTNGKSTTTALIAHCLQSAGVKTELGGNIGRPVLDLAPFEDDKIYVIEFSSYQIDLTPSLSPTVAILLNITPDHLDRHGSLEGYAATKAKIFGKLTPQALGVIGLDDEPCRNIAEELNGPYSLCPISIADISGQGIHFQNGQLTEVKDGQPVTSLSLLEMPTLRGTHNAQNAAASYAACKFLGQDAAQIEMGLKTFPGLAHRMEILGNAGQTLFVNDSKATNADAASKALSSFKNIFWIAGGLAKEGGIESLEPFHQNITKAYLVGQCSSVFAKSLQGKVPYEECGTLENAVAMAAADAAKSSATEPVVLLSPAAASFDQFPNFMLRGDAFRSAVTAIDDYKPLESERGAA